MLFTFVWFRGSFSCAHVNLKVQTLDTYIRSYFSVLSFIWIVLFLNYFFFQIVEPLQLYVINWWHIYIRREKEYRFTAVVKLGRGGGRGANVASMYIYMFLKLLFSFLGHPSLSGDLLLSVFVRRQALWTFPSSCLKIIGVARVNLVCRSIKKDVPRLWITWPLSLRRQKN